MDSQCLEVAIQSGHINNRGCGTEKSYYFFTLFVDLELEEERETDDREGEERVTRALDVLVDEREEEEFLDGDTRLGEYDLELEEDLILDLEEDRLGAE